MAAPRICVISSGLDRFHEPCTHILKKQIGLDKTPIDFYGMFWQPVNDDKLNQYVQGFANATIWTSPQRSFDDIPNAPKPPETNVKNFLSMIWGKYLLGQQMAEHGIWEKYDIFLYCRPDVCFDNVLDLAALQPHLAEYDLFIPTNGQWRGGINDQVCFGGRKLAVALSLFPEVTRYIQDGVLLHPETMLLHHLTKNGVRLAQFPIQNFIFRSETRFHVG